MREALQFVASSRPFAGVYENVQQMTVKDEGDSCSASNYVEQELKLMSYKTQVIHVNMGHWHRLTRHRSAQWVRRSLLIKGFRKISEVICRKSALTSLLKMLDSLQT